MLGVERDGGRGRPAAATPAPRPSGTARVVLLKSRHTLVADPDGRVRVTTVGPPWLATAGAGDVLGGLVGALLAAGLDPFDAARVGLVGARRRGRRWPAPADRSRAGEVAAARARGCARGCCVTAERSETMTRDRHDRRCRRRARRDRRRPRRGPRATSRRSRQPVGAGRADGRGEGRRLRPRDGRGRPRRPRRRAPTWLGVAVLEEALALRAAGDTGPVLCWLAVPGEDYARPVEAGVDVTAYTVDEVDEIVAAAAAAGRPARLQLKVDTGLGRGGAAAADWPDAGRGRGRGAEEAGRVRVTGIWSHFACADEPEHPANDAQEQAFREALDVADAAGLDPEVRHLANSAAALLRPSRPVRPGPVRASRRTASRPAPELRTAAELGLVPGDDRARPARRGQAGARRLRGLLRPHLRHRPRDTTLGVVPVGYGDGRARARVLDGAGAGRPAGAARSPAGSAWTSSSSTSATTPAAAGDEVVLFGPGRRRGAHRAGLGARRAAPSPTRSSRAIGGRMRRAGTSDGRGRQ